MQTMLSSTSEGIPASVAGGTGHHCVTSYYVEYSQAIMSFLLTTYNRMMWFRFKVHENWHTFKKKQKRKPFLSAFFLW